MRFYLASWVGDGTAENPYRVAADNPRLIDLRPDETVVDGPTLIRTPEAVASPPREWVDLGDGLDVSMPRGVSRALERTLGVTLDQTSNLRAIIAELLILHGEDLPRGVRSRWRPIKADHRGRHRIVLGEPVYDAPAVQGATVSDDFDRADAATLGGAWTVESDDFGIDTNRAVYDGGAARYARYDTDLDSDDHFAEALGMTVDSNNQTVAGVTVRHSPTETTYYWARINQDSHVRIFKRITGSYTQIHEGSNLGLGDPWDVDLYLSFDGSSWEVKVDDVQESTGTDTSITGNLRAGLSADTAGDPPVKAYWGSWQAQDLGAGGTPATVTPSTIVATAAVPTPSASGKASVSPSTVAATAAVPGPSPQGEASTSPAAVAATASLPTPVATIGKTVTPSTITAIAALPAPTPLGEAVVTVSVIAATTTLPTPSPSTGTVAEPAVIPTTVALPTPTAEGKAAVSPSVVVASVALPAPTPTVDVSVSPSTFTVVVALPATTVSGGAVVTPSTIQAVVDVLEPSITGVELNINALAYYQFHRINGNLVLAPVGRSARRGFRTGEGFERVSDIIRMDQDPATGADPDSAMEAVASVWATHSGSDAATLKAQIHSALQVAGWRAQGGGDLT